jgi:hypothetical protein
MVELFGWLALAKIRAWLKGSQRVFEVEIPIFRRLANGTI